MGKSKTKSTRKAARVPSRNSRVSDIQQLNDRITRLEESLPANHPLHPDAGGGRSPLKHPEDIALGEPPRPPRAPRVTRGQRARQRK